MVKGVKTVTEGKRGCGYRKAGGKYLISEGVSMPCPALPLEVSRCPCCDAGIKPTRSWAWFSPKMFFKFPCPAECEIYQEKGRCPPFTAERAGIMWVGTSHYPTPEDWAKEAREMGASKRISQIPKDLVVGETWVFVGHRKAIKEPCPYVNGEGVHDDECGDCDDGWIYKPGVFHAFRPVRIEKVVDEDVTQEEVDKLLKRGITPVFVKRIDKDGNPVDEDGNLIEQKLFTE
jgi:hypothetical protein